MSGAPELPISPLVGEMSGRTEGGAKELYVSIDALYQSITTLPELPLRIASNPT
jgi:hypothetical protein